MTSVADGLAVETSAWNLALAGGGDMGALMRSHEWSNSPIGHPQTWPQTLLSAVSMMLPSKHIMFVAWGPELAFLYNDAYRPVFGRKHPWALGRPFQEIWPEAWPTVKPLIDAALAGEATWSEDLPLVLERNGYPEDCWFTFSYSPLRDEDGKVAGLFCAAAETTKRVLAERRLLAERERQRLLFEQVPGFVGILRGPEHVFEYVNDAYDRVAGTRGFVGKTVREAFPDLQGTGLFEALDHAFATGKPYVARDVPLSLQRTPGAEADPLILSFTYQPIVEDSGTVTGIFIQGQDVTQAHEAHTALRANEARQALLIQLLRSQRESGDPDAMMGTASEAVGRFLKADRVGFFETADNKMMDFSASWTNGALPPLTGPMPVSIIGSRYLVEVQAGRTLGINDTATDPLTAESRFGEIGVRSSIGAPIVRSGRWNTGFYVHQATVREWTPDEVAFVLEVAEQTWDAVERARAAAEARDSEDRFRVFAQSMPIHVWSARPDGYVDWFNDQGYAHTGYPSGGLEGGAWTQTVHPDDLARAEGAWLHSLATGERYEIQFRIRRSDGVFRCFLIRADPVRSDDGQIILWIGTDTDVESQNRQKAALTRLNATLEEQVEERTRELSTTTASLRQAQKMEAMGQLTGGVAHDFNNLLTPILGSLDLLSRRGVGNDRERRLIEGALQSADRAKTLVQRLLAFARRQPLQATAVDLGALVAGMAALIGSTVGPSIDVQVIHEDELPPANADANQLEMAILNLGVNARDAMPDGGTLTIKAIQESVVDDDRSGLKPGQYIRLSVADTGAGMDETTLARATEPFFSTKGIGKGTGLGLSMVHGLAAQLGGGLTIISEPGHGTSVELWLPVSLGQLEHKNEIEAEPTMERSRGCALLVDDEELVRMSTADMLGDLGYDVVEVASADQALRLLDEGLIPDLVITDHLMPGMSGGELAAELRARNLRVPILIVSGYAEAEGIAPEFPRLSKPFRNAELAQSVASIMRQGGDS